MPVYLGMVVILIIGPEQFVKTVTNLSCLTLKQIQPESPRYCAEFTTMCNHMLGHTVISQRLDHT